MSEARQHRRALICVEFARGSVRDRKPIRFTGAQRNSAKAQSPTPDFQNLLVRNEPCTRRNAAPTGVPSVTGRGVSEQLASHCRAESVSPDQEPTNRGATAIVEHGPHAVLVLFEGANCPAKVNVPLFERSKKCR